MTYVTHLDDFLCLFAKQNWPFHLLSAPRGLKAWASDDRHDPLGKIAIADWLTALISVGSLVGLFRWSASDPLLVTATRSLG